MKRIFLVSGLFLFVFVIMGCGSTFEIAHWSFEYLPCEVIEIRVVELDGSYSDYREFDRIICNIDLSKVDLLYEDVLKLEWERRDLESNTPKGFCILLIYKNGDADLISYNEPVKYRMDDEKMMMIGSALYGDNRDFEENFLKLIIKYLSN